MSIRFFENLGLFWPVNGRMGAQVEDNSNVLVCENQPSKLRVAGSSPAAPTIASLTSSGAPGTPDLLPERLPVIYVHVELHGHVNRASPGHGTPRDVALDAHRVRETPRDNLCESRDCDLHGRRSP
jgi:hypothetical protein